MPRPGRFFGARQATGGVEPFQRIIFRRAERVRFAGHNKLTSLPPGPQNLCLHGGVMGRPHFCLLADPITVTLGLPQFRCNPTP